MKLSVKGNNLDGPATIGEVAHIYGIGPNSPRPNPDGISVATNEYDNLILLCRNHHRLVDAQASTYTVAKLRKWKLDLEFWVDESLRTGDFNDSHLEQIINWLSDTKIDANDEKLDLTAIAKKTAMNSFSTRVSNQIDMALIRVSQVGRYIEYQEAIEDSYSRRLLSRLLARYGELKPTRLESNAIFAGMRQFACGYSADIDFQLAGLALIVYFFERCDLFES